jgi:hypothetical protein
MDYLLIEWTGALAKNDHGARTEAEAGVDGRGRLPEAQ